MHQVQNEGQDICEYLLNIPLDKWATFYASCPKWGERTSNASQSGNIWKGDVRDGSILDLHADLLGKGMQQLYHRFKKYSYINTLRTRD
jgi:hypothetical protein